MYDNNPNHRQEHVFWIVVKCPTCNHDNGLRYLPDLLNGPKDISCASKNNRYSKWHLIPHSFGLALDEEGKSKVRNFLTLAIEYDLVRARALTLRSILSKEFG